MLNNFLKKPTKKQLKNNAPITMNMVVDDEMALSEHIEEFSQRLVYLSYIFTFCNAIVLCRC